MDQNSFSNLKEEILKGLSRNKIKCVNQTGTELLISEQHKLTIIDSFVNQPIQESLNGNIIIGGPTLPLVVIVCEKCGNVQYYALRKLVPSVKL